MHTYQKQSLKSNIIQSLLTTRPKKIEMSPTSTSMCMRCWGGEKCEFYSLFFDWSNFPAWNYTYIPFLCIENFDFSCYFKYFKYIFGSSFFAHQLANTISRKFFFFQHKDEGDNIDGDGYEVDIDVDDRNKNERTNVHIHRIQR